MSRNDFESVVLPHRAALLGHALSLTRNSDEAEDLVQETTLRALRGFATFRDDGPVRAWLLAILRNLFRSDYRARARAPRAVSLDAIEQNGRQAAALLVAPVRHRGRASENNGGRPLLLAGGTAGACGALVLPSVPGPERAVFSRLENEALNRAVAQLPPCYRDVLVLSDMGGLSYEEIGDRLGVPIGTVRSRLSRARGRVRRALFAWRPDTAASERRLPAPPRFST